MTIEQRIRNLQVPAGPIDVVLDTDAYNEIDDQFAIAYLLRSGDRLNTKAIYAAPFFNAHSTGPEDGMLRSYDEIIKLLKLAGEDARIKDVYRGSVRYLPDEKTPVDSDAARDLCDRAMNYSPEKPLYVVAIGAITNIASALLMKPEIAERIVVVWLGGTGLEIGHSREFNMRQDVAAARVVMSSGAPFVQLPCAGVVSAFTISKPELLYWLADKNPLADYLARNTIREADEYAAGKPWTRVIWDVTAVAWLLNDGGRFMSTRLIPTPMPEYDDRYGANPDGDLMCYVYSIHRDALMEDLINKLTK
ncbi:MAG: nucleoside hydrolase [Ruminococcaceae bacterium]|nr:nucleoside hydrolase [Oscillospiraceae bacterium]